MTNKNTQTVLAKTPPMELLPNPPNASKAVHNVYELKTKPEIIRYYHLTTGFPTKRTCIRAIKCGNFVSWPGLTIDAARKHFPESEETQKGHIRTQHQCLQSTQVRMVPEVIEEDFGKDDDIVPQPSKKQKDIFVVVRGHHNREYSTYVQNPTQSIKRQESKTAQLFC